jgi:ferric-dicitrate binding protein FerR (iron transport regulator)
MNEERKAIEWRFKLAKKKFTESCRLVLSGHPTAQEATKEAFAEVQRCRAELASLDNESTDERR